MAFLKRRSNTCNGFWKCIRGSLRTIFIPIISRPNGRWLKKRVQLIGVQHHHAHIASCMAENHLDGKVIGIALDGTGYGTDGAVWGGEVLLADYGDFERAAHFEYVPLPGGAAAIHEPWRVALSYLVKHYVKDLDRLDLPFLRGIDARRPQRYSANDRPADPFAAHVELRAII